ncbi:hypothetical protein [Desulfobotulus sp.]|jgi:hypothetical protein|uniref:hypothetical protein n=1 Tax=Desulfobotulus sp. TaxID=1940337 RepID=UPI002A360763|nr:hypothetical protein [Desulfobotulus sp.]MDY0163325.1 hypothetical protein [Desulfobotulus sp.]
MRERYKLSDLMKEVEQDEEIKKQDMNRKLSQEQIRKMFSSLKGKDKGQKT